VIPIEKSFLFQHMVGALAADPSWDVHMYIAYNEISDARAKELIAAYDKYLTCGGGAKDTPNGGGE
jgi:hypothetical protein